MRVRRALLVGLASWQATALAAQGASPYVPLHYWAMPYIEHLIARGTLADPTPLTRPLHADDLVRVLEAADTTGLNAAERRIVRDILADLRPPHTDRPWVRANGDVTAAGASHARRDPLRAAGPSHATAAGGLDLQVALGRVMLVTHPYFDTRLKYDPDWFGKKDRVIAGRVAEAYIAARWRLGELFFGRLDRNWGPSGIQGLLLSDNPYGLDHLGFTVGTARFQLQAIVTQLDDRIDSTGALAHRYMVQHRLWTRPGRRWTVALWEGSVLSGPGREIEPWYLNILNVGYLEQLNTGTTVNNFLGLDFERHATVTLFGQFMLDDVKIEHKGPADLLPASYGFTVGAKGGVGRTGIDWCLFYTQVSNLTYRNQDNVEVPLYHFLGTGRNFDDYDQATLQLTLLHSSGLLLAPEVTLLRQGEGDPRLPYPPLTAFGSTPSLFAGVVERTVRLALGANWDRGPLGLAANGGVHFIHNAGHVAGTTDTKFVGGIAVSYRFRRQGKVP